MPSFSRFFSSRILIAAGTGALGVGWGYHSIYELNGAGAHGVIEACHSLTTDIDAFFAGREKAA